MERAGGRPPRTAREAAEPGPAVSSIVPQTTRRGAALSRLDRVASGRPARASTALAPDRGRVSDAPRTSQREQSAAWDAAVDRSGLPVVVGDSAKPRPRVIFGAPLTVGMASEGELLELVLTERLPPGGSARR